MYTFYTANLKGFKAAQKTLQVSWFELFLSVINIAIWSAKTICKQSCNNFQVNTTNSIPQGIRIISRHISETLKTFPL